MSAAAQFYIFKKDRNFSSDQLAEISDAVNTRSRILAEAMDNLRHAAQYSDPKLSERTAVVKTPKRVARKKTKAIAAISPKQEVLKGKVSYKVKGPDGKPMNIAEIKGWINSIYDGNQGIIKQ